jgi:hypothetical protein
LFPVAGLILPDEKKRHYTDIGFIGTVVGMVLFLVSKGIHRGQEEEFPDAGRGRDL